MSAVPIFYIVVIAIFGIAARPTENRKITNDQRNEANNNNGIIGIASIAGITSRNGRVSSVGGVKFFPGTDSVNEYFYPLELSSERDNIYPVTVSAEKDGRYASGTVQVNPGYVSASARAGYGSPRTESRIGFNPSNVVPQQPFQEFFFQPQPGLYPRNLNNWFVKDFFQGFHPPAPEVMRKGWMINEFNPFMNFWR